MDAIRSKLTYANIAATLAVVIACSSGAYAVGLAKNSVKSSHIKNGQVRTADIKNNTVTGKDVNEAKLKRVPDTAKLGGKPAVRFSSTSPDRGRAFLGGDELTAEIPGYGVYRLSCEANVPGNLTDDTVSYGYDNFLGGNATTDMTLTRGGYGVDAVVESYVYRAFDGAAFDAQPTVRVDQVIRAATGAKAIRITGVGWDDATTAGCAGRLDTQILR